jgi:hypothetical protein
MSGQNPLRARIRARRLKGDDHCPNTAKALEWLDIAARLRDPQLIKLKTEPPLDPARKEPRFQAIQRYIAVGSTSNLSDRHFLGDVMTHSFDLVGQIVDVRVDALRRLIAPAIDVGAPSD